MRPHDPNHGVNLAMLLGTLIACLVIAIFILLGGRPVLV